MRFTLLGEQLGITAHIHEQIPISACTKIYSFILMTPNGEWNKHKDRMSQTQNGGW
jgi:hypothetical protein